MESLKKLLSVCLLMFCLSLPAFGGHTQAGNWCDCGGTGCFCDPGEVPGGHAPHALPKPDKTPHNAPADFGSGTLLVVAVLLLMLRYKS